jgi:hypothetical protein
MTPRNFPIGSPAAARLFAQRQESKRKLAWLAREKEAFVFRILRPR